MMPTWYCLTCEKGFPQNKAKTGKIKMRGHVVIGYLCPFCGGSRIGVQPLEKEGKYDN